jgi:hypothetical protein
MNAPIHAHGHAHGHGWVQSSAASARPYPWMGMGMPCNACGHARNDGTRPSDGCTHPVLPRTHTVGRPQSCLALSQASVGWVHPSTRCLHPSSVWMPASSGLSEGMARADVGSSRKTPPSSSAFGFVSRIPATLVTIGLHRVLDGWTLGPHLRARPLSARGATVEYGWPSAHGVRPSGSRDPAFGSRLRSNPPSSLLDRE